MQSRYTSLLPLIQQMENLDLPPWELIPYLNNFIIQNGISDKPIALTDKAFDLASWNIACGAKWVDATLQPGQTRQGGINNPTFNNAMDHDARMSCCAAIIKVMMLHDVDTVVLQEAPTNPNDVFYKLTGASPAVNAKQNANIHRAVIGAVEKADKYTTEIVNALNQRGIQPHEYQVVSYDKRGYDEYIVNVHIDCAPNGWKPTANEPLPRQWQQDRADALQDVINWAAQKNIIVYIMGDTNIINAHLNPSLTNAEFFAARGCNTEDVVMAQRFHQVNPLHISPLPSNVQVKQPAQPSSSTTPVISSSSTSSGLFSKTKPVEKIKNKTLLENLTEEKLGVEAMIKEHGLALNSSALDQTYKQKLKSEIVEAEQKLPLINFQINYIKDPKMSNKSEGMSEKIKKAELKSIAEVMEYAVEHPASRTAKILKDMQILDVTQSSSPMKK